MNNSKIKFQSIINKLALIAALLLTQLTAAQMTYAQADPKPQLFEGVIGGAPIIMELTTNADHTVTGRYFYQKHILDIALDGTKLVDGSVQLGENQQYGDDKKF